MPRTRVYLNTTFHDPWDRGLQSLSPAATIPKGNFLYVKFSATDLHGFTRIKTTKNSMMNLHSFLGLNPCKSALICGKELDFPKLTSALPKS